MCARKSIDWRDAAAKLATLIPHERLEGSVVRWAETRSRRETWGVAFSGGPDSLALLLLLWAHWPDRRGRFVALHFDHRLRGAESRADATFCRTLCASLGVRFIGEAWKRTRSAVAPSEAESRAARMEFFAKHARVVWLGHQQDDIAETFFMRLARGSGSGGLAAPRPLQRLPGKRVHVRPLLALKKAEIVAALRAAKILWREDSTNAGRDFFRNRIRRDVLPAWIAAAERDALAGAARSRMLLDEDDEALDALLDELRVIQSAPRGRRRGAVLECAALAGKPRALWRRALHRWLAAQPRAGDLARQAFETLLDAIQRRVRTRHSLGREGFAVTDGEQLWFEMAGKKRRSFRRRTN